MTGRKPTEPAGGRKDRLRAALRENLKRRKAQVRGRSEVNAERSGGPHDSAGIVQDKPKS